MPKSNSIPAEVFGKPGVLHGRNQKTYAQFEHDGEPWVIEDFCPHRGGPLSEGTLENGLVTCPWHGARFRLRDGKCENGVTERRMQCFRLHQWQEAFPPDSASDDDKT